MADGVACGNCGTILPNEDGSAPPEQRKPCPVCGSRVRAYSMNAEAGMHIVTGADVTFERISPSAVLIVKGIVSFGERTDEGRLITEVLAPWFESIDLLTRDPEESFRIPYWKWEEIVAGAYRRANFDEVTLTPRKEDRGRDVIAVKKGLVR